MLVRPDAPEEESLEALHARAALLEAQLAERSAESQRLRAALAAFERRYRQEVGQLHEQLDELEYAIAEAELGQLRTRLDDATQDRRDPPPPQAAPVPRFTSDAVRKLFRDVARTIHPDLARDPTTRDRFHDLMVEANRAYVRGDEAHLRWILEAWEKSPEAVQGSDDEAVRRRLERRIEQLDEQLAHVARERGALEDAPLWQLKVMVDEAASRGKDIVRDMVARLQRDIMVATHRLDAMRPPPPRT